MVKNPVITYILIAINIIIYLAVVIKSGGNIINIDAQNLFYYGGLVKDGNFLNIFSSMFMHGSVMHILFNMYALFWLGMIAEEELGQFYYSVAYVFTGVCGGLAVILFSDPRTVTVGASGAVFGLMGVLCVYAFLSNKPWKTALINPILVNVAFTVYSMANGGNISALGHFGGLISGAVIGYGIYLHEKNTPVDFAEYEYVQEQLIPDPHFIDISYQENPIEKKMKKSFLKGMTIIAVSIVLAISGCFHSVKGSSGIRDYDDYINQIFQALSLSETVIDTFNKEIAGANLSTPDQHNTLKNIILPKQQEMIDIVKDVDIDNEELLKINKILLKSYELDIEIYNYCLDYITSPKNETMTKINDSLAKSEKYKKEFDDDLIKFRKKYNIEVES
jgi:rhomboid protease GluP